jgi:hypothetical protein
MTMTEEARKIRRYVDRNYGDAITVETPAYYASKKYWTAELKSDYPRRVHDDYRNESFVKFLEIKDLGEVRLTDDNHITGPPREKLTEKLDLRLRQWRERAQVIIMSASAEELAHLGALKDSIMPITVVIRYLAQKDNTEVTHDQLKKADIDERWIQFLVDIKLIQPTESGFTYSNLFTSLETESTSAAGKRSTEEFVSHVIAHIMKNYYSTIRQVFKVWRFETYLHAATCYYGPSIEAGRMLYRNPDSLNRLYHKWYSKTYSDLRLQGIFQELETQKILTRVENYWYGSKEIWGKLEPLIQTMPQVLTASRG